MEAVNYLTLEGLTYLYPNLTEEEKETAEILIPIASAGMREEARKRGRDLDIMIRENPDLALIAKSVCADIINRQLEQQNAPGPSTLSQESQAALNYSWSGTYVNTGGGLTILNKDLKRLGLLRPRYGVIDLWAPVESKAKPLY